MQLKLLIYFLFFFFTISYSKKHEIGIFIGNFNLISNIGKYTHAEIIPVNWNNSKSTSIGINYIYKLNSRHNIKLNIILSNLIFNNSKSMNYNIYKNKQINDNIITNIGINFNYYFWNQNVHQKTMQINPYIFGGLEILNYQTKKNYYNYQLNNNFNKTIKYNIVNINTLNKKINKTTLSLSYGFGIQLNYIKNWIFFSEISLHPTFINDLDYNFNKQNKINYNINNNTLLSQPYLNIFIKKFQNDTQKRKIVNNITNDWYIITNIGATYIFG